MPADTSRVKVNYKGTMIDGTDSNSSKEPITLAVNRVIPGWTEALKMMPVGSKWELYILRNWDTVHRKLVKSNLSLL